MVVSAHGPTPCSRPLPEMLASFRISSRSDLVVLPDERGQIRVKSLDLLKHRHMPGLDVGEQQAASIVSYKFRGGVKNNLVIFAAHHQYAVTRGLHGRHDRLLVVLRWVTIVNTRYTGEA